MNVLAARLVDALGSGAVRTAPEDLAAYAFDAYSEARPPSAAVVPSNARDVAAVVRIAREFGEPIVPRGAGTGLCGGSVPAEGGIVVSFARMNRILEVDVRNRRARVQPGLINLDLSLAVRAAGLFYAPDPSSQKISSLGGNVGTNAGGAHCLSYGTTTNHVLGLEYVDQHGTLVRTSIDDDGYDLTGLIVGSEGTLGIVTEIEVRLLRVPPSVRVCVAAFPDVESASAAVSAVVGSGLLPTQTVDQSGEIIVPFAGQIHAAGRTTPQVQAAIVAALRGKANETQALVEVVQTTDNAVTVTGDVNHPGRFPLMMGGTKLLDAISLAGGANGKARDMLIQLTRGGVVRNLRLVDLLSDPQQNIYLQPDDLVTLDQEPQTVVVLGAMVHNSEVPFGKSKVTLAEAIGDGGGLADHLADPYGVYVLRYEKLSVARSLTTEPLPDYLQAGETVPVVYQINFKTADGLLLAQSFVMRDRDLVYVADSPSVQVGKLARLFDVVTSIFKSGSVHSYSY